MAVRSSDSVSATSRRSQLPYDIIGGIVAVTLVLGTGVTARYFQYASTPHLTNTVLPKAPEFPLPFELLDRSEQAGLSHQHEPFATHPSLKNVAPFIVGTEGASVAVIDYDGDGWQDVYFTNARIGSLNALFRNNHDGTFTDVAEKAGLAKVNEVSGSLRALFFDADNDGSPDLLLTTTGCPRFFHNRGNGTFEDTTARAGLEVCGIAHAANVLDFDGDGRLDVIVAGFYKKIDLLHPDTTNFMPTLQRAKGGGSIALYRNLGGGRFGLVPGARGIKDRGWTHSIGVYDLRGTGRKDLYFATDFGEDYLYWNEGDHYSDASTAFVGRNYDTEGMNSLVFDPYNDGAPGVYVTEIFEPGHGETLNNFWKITPDHRLEDKSAALGIHQCGWSWGAAFLDFDNDMHLDLAVTNGFISGDPNRSYWYEEGLVKSGNLATDARYWPSLTGASLAGYESKCVFYSQGNHFKDVSTSTAMGQDRSDGRGLAVIDVMNNGTPSLVQANVAQRSKFFLNIPKHTNHWVGLSLKGTRSNRDAFGAKVSVVTPDGVRQTREQQAANGFEAQSDMRLLFGLGSNQQVQSVEIEWPAGGKQTLKNLEIDRYHSIEEPR